MNLFRITKSDLKLINGFLPINKPSGVCCNKLNHLLRTDLHFVLNNHKVVHGLIEISYARALEPFAEGLVTFIYGFSNLQRRNFIFADYQYRAVVEFGVERSSNSIAGLELSRVKTDHLNIDYIREALDSFKGTYEQAKSNFLRSDIRDLELSEKLATPEGIYDLVEWERSKAIKKNFQKYPFPAAMKDVICQDVKLIDYIEPFATIDIFSNGGFSVRQFSHDLGKKLGTKASLVKLTRYKEGPMHFDDPMVLQLHETQLEHYIHKMPVMQKRYKNYLDELNDRFESTRPRFKPFI